MITALSRSAACLVLVLTACTAHAQEVALPHLWITDGLVQSLALRGDTLFVGGDYGYVGPPTGQMAVLDKASGEADITQPRFGDGSSQSSVRVILPTGDGGYYVGGYFSRVSGYARINLARVLPDGTLDPGFAPNPVNAGSSYIGSVDALALDPDVPSPSGKGVLYVGGFFQTIGGEPRRDLAAVDAATGELLSFDAQLGGPPAGVIGVHDLQVRDGALYAGGTFSTVGGAARPGGVALDGATGELLPWAVEIDGWATPVALSESTAYLYGDFEVVNGEARQWWAEVELFEPGDGGGELMEWTPQQTVYGFDFTLAEEHLWVLRWHPPILVRIDRKTGAVEHFQVSDGLRSGRGLAYDPEGGASGTGVIYIACSRSFGPGGTQQHPIVVAVDPATGQPTGYEVIGGGGRQDYRDARTIAVEPGPGGRVLVGGQQFSFGGVRRSGLVALDTETGRPVEGFDDTYPAQDLTLSPDGRYLYAMNAEIGFMLREFDLETGETRDLPTDAPSPGVTPRPPGPERILGGETALIATEDMLYGAAGGLFAIDRESGASVWQRPAAVYQGARYNGKILLVDGPGGSGGDDGTLYWAGPLAWFVNGPDIEAFAAARPRTGEILDWDVQAGGSSPIGGTVGWFDGDGVNEARLFITGNFQGLPGAPERRRMAAVDPMTAQDLGWEAPVWSGAGPHGPLIVHERPPEAGGGSIIYAPTSRPTGESFPDVFDVITAEPEDWNMDLGGFVFIPSARHNALFLGGTFRNSLRGSGHAHVVAVTPLYDLLPPVSGEPGPERPRVAALSAPFPNPARYETSLTLILPEAGSVEVAVYDVLGRRVAVLHEGPLAAGDHALAVDTSSLASGLYVVRASGEGFAVSRRMTVVR